VSDGLAARCRVNGDVCTCPAVVVGGRWDSAGPLVCRDWRHRSGVGTTISVLPVGAVLLPQVPFLGGSPVVTASDHRPDPLIPKTIGLFTWQT
jgi:hypothetical protein